MKKISLSRLNIVYVIKGCQRSFYVLDRQEKSYFEVGLLIFKVKSPVEMSELLQIMQIFVAKSSKVCIEDCSTTKIYEVSLHFENFGWEPALLLARVEME